MNDAQWIQRLHACGLLKASFRPTTLVIELRSYLRVRERLLDYAAAHIQHMQKALTFMNIQLKDKTSGTVKVLVKHTEVVYPEPLLEQNLSGYVTLHYSVSREGPNSQSVYLRSRHRQPTFWQLVPQQ